MALPWENHGTPFKNQGTQSLRDGEGELLGSSSLPLFFEGYFVQLLSLSRLL